MLEFLLKNPNRDSSWNRAVINELARVIFNKDHRIESEEHPDLIDDIYFSRLIDEDWLAQNHENDYIIFEYQPDDSRLSYSIPLRDDDEPWN